MKQYLELFLEEAKEHLENLTNTLIILEKEEDNTEALNTLFRSAHTLKSSSAMMGYQEISSLSHAMEDVFDAIIDTFLVNLSMNEEKAVLLKTRLICGGDVEGVLVMFLNKELQAALIEKGKQVLHSNS